MAFTDLGEGILELFAGAQGAAPYAARAQFNARNGFIPCWTDAEKYQAWKSRHVCPKCRKPMPAGGAAHCEKCIKNAVSKLKTRREQWRTENRCSNCGGARDCGKGRCRACLDKQREYTAKFKARRVATP